MALSKASRKPGGVMRWPDCALLGLALLLPRCAPFASTRCAAGRPLSRHAAAHEVTPRVPQSLSGL